GAAGRELRRLGLILGLAPAASDEFWVSEDLLAGANKLLTRADELLAYAQAHRQLVESLPAICPLPRGSFEVSSGFGVRVSPFTGSYERHKGVDLAAPAGLPVKATGKGVVLFAGRVGPENPSWARLGNVVVVEHGDWFVTIFAHLKEVLVGPGQHVKRGDVVGVVGSTGWSTAPHLHYEVRRKVGDNTLVPTDPFFFMLDYPVAEVAKAVGGEEDAAFDLLPEEEHWPWLKTKRYPR
ncbi:MAG: M23 family metallopeptidase, partial [Thermoanaerobaculum sp.]